MGSLDKQNTDKNSQYVEFWLFWNLNRGMKIFGEMQTLYGSIEKRFTFCSWLVPSPSWVLLRRRLSLFTSWPHAPHVVYFVYVHEKSKVQILQNFNETFETYINIHVSFSKNRICENFNKIRFWSNNLKKWTVNSVIFLRCFQTDENSSKQTIV